MENKKETGKIVFKPGYILRHTDLPGEKNPLPKLPEGLRWKGFQRRGDKNNEFISYIVDDPNGPQPTIDELPPDEEPLFKTKEEAEKYRESHLKETEDYDPTSVWRWTDYDKD